MMSPKIQTQPQPKFVVDPKSSDDREAMPLPAPSQDHIRERAYQLYESRGGEPGQDEQDWLRAEQQILKPKR
jgi:hypothetical protein